MAVQQINSNLATNSARASVNETYHSLNAVDAKVDNQKGIFASFASKASSLFGKSVSDVNDKKPTLNESLGMLTEKCDSLKTTPSGQEVSQLVAPLKTIESQLDVLSKTIDLELAKPEKERNYETLQAAMYMLIMLMMRKTAKTDHEFITQMGNEIKVKTKQIEETYKNVTVLAITLVSSVISIASGAAGLAPLMPERFVAAEVAKKLAKASSAIGTTGSGVQSLGSVFSTRTEGKRTVIQMDLRRVESKEEDRKGAKHSSKEILRSTLDALKGLWEKVHNAFSSQAQ